MEKDLPSVSLLFMQSLHSPRACLHGKGACVGYMAAPVASFVPFRPSSVTSSACCAALFAMSLAL